LALVSIIFDWETTGRGRVRLIEQLMAVSLTGRGRTAETIIFP
jgi:hypothetical protein